MVLQKGYSMTDFSRVRAMAMNIVNTVQDKDRDYGSSWKKRGGPGAFMVMARKWDRIENMASKEGYDIFKLLHANTGDIQDDVKDLIGYLHLILDEVGLDAVQGPEQYDLFRSPESIHPKRKGYVADDGDDMFEVQGYIGNDMTVYACRQCNAEVRAATVQDAHREHGSCAGPSYVAQG